MTIIRTVFIVLTVLVILYLVMNYFFVKSTTLTRLRSAKETQLIKASTIPNNYNTNNYSYSIWFYVDDWNYRFGEPKVLLSRMSEDKISKLVKHKPKPKPKCPAEFPYPVEKGEYVKAGLCYNKEDYAKKGSGPAGSWCAFKPEFGGIQEQINIGDGIKCIEDVVSQPITSTYTTTIEDVPGPSIVFGAMENDITISVTCYPSTGASNKNPIIHKCTVKNFPLQSWVNLAISLYGRTLDIYIDGKLVRTCVLPGIAKVDPSTDVLITPMGGFGGYTTNIQYWDTAINPEQAYNIYRQGFGGNILGELFDKYRVKVSFLEDNKVHGSFEL